MDSQANMAARAYSEIHRLKQQVGSLEAWAAWLRQDREQLVKIQGLQQKLCGEYAGLWHEAQERCRSLEAQVKELEGRLRPPAQDKMQQAG